jgi:hypothetical protein
LAIIRVDHAVRNARLPNGSGPLEVNYSARPRSTRGRQYDAAPLLQWHGRSLGREQTRRSSTGEPTAFGPNEISAITSAFEETVLELLTPAIRRWRPGHRCSALIISWAKRTCNCCGQLQSVNLTWQGV